MPGLWGVDAGLGVEQVRRGDVGQDLSRLHVGLAKATGGVPVQIQGAQPFTVQAHREGEHRRQPLGAGPVENCGKRVSEARSVTATATPVR